MKALIPVIDENRNEPYYQQIYNYIKNEIMNGQLQAGDKLPSLRSLAKTTGLSITTIDQAYSQLTVEGYVESKAQSGYYVNQLNYALNDNTISLDTNTSSYSSLLDNSMASQKPKLYHDPECFNFTKWKKCMNKIINDYPESLFFESDPQGEMALRAEIAKYLYMSRGVSCSPEQIIIGAGTQQITNHISNILRRLHVEHIAMEKPGYKPVRNIFRDRGFAITDVPVANNGIRIEKLPTNIKTVSYVSPSNHIFTGSVMPVGRRYELINWAIDNDSYIIEDDYDSELRYFGRPIPALKSLNDHDRVIYLGSFSITLFAAVKISYMVLPKHMAELFASMATDYAQTCSKLDQLSLAMFMETGNYQTHLKKLRKLYSQKLNAVTTYFKRNGAGLVDMKSSSSGLNLLIKVNSSKSSSQIKEDAANLGIPLVPLESNNLFLLYYNQIPLDQIPLALEALLASWRFDV